MGQTKLLRFALNLYLIKIFSLNLISIYCRMQGVELVGSIIALLQVISVIIISIFFLTHKKQLHFNKECKGFLFIFFIYWAYCFFYILKDPQMAFNNMSYLSDSWYRFWLDSFLLIVPVFLNNYFYKYADFELVSKVVVIIISVFFIFYYIQINPGYYVSFRLSGNLTELGIIDGLAIDAYAGIGILLSFILKDRWSRNHLLNNIIFLSIIFTNSSIMVIANERGPVLFLFFTIICYYYLKNSVRLKFFLMLLCVLLVFSLFYDRIINFLYFIAPDLFERFSDISSDKGSGRYGDDQSAYSEAIRQILNGPFFGTYPRITDAYARSYGMYPHNFFLEILMTFGLFFSLILCYYLVLIFRKARYIIQNKHNLIYIMAIAAFCFLSLQTSSTLYMNERFWLPFAIITNLQLKQR